MTERMKSAGVRLSMMQLSSIVIFFGVIASIIFQFSFSKTIEVGDGCGWDGAQYCAMAEGRWSEVVNPFRRRILLPFFASLLPFNTILNFQLIQLAGVSFIVITTYFYFRTDIRRNLKKNTSRSGNLSAISGPFLLALSAIFAARNMIHLSMWLPVNTDLWAFAFLYATLVLVTMFPTNKTAFILASTFLICAPLVRETNAIPVLVVVIVKMALRELMLLKGLFLLICGVFGTFNAMNGAGTGSVLDTYTYWLEFNFSSLLEIARFLTMTLLALGPFVFLVFNRKLHGQSNSTYWLFIVAAGVLFFISVLGGGDTDRILMPVGLLLTLASLKANYKRAEVHLPTILFTIAFVVSQSPFQIMGATADSILSFIGLRYTSYINLVNYGIAPLVLGGLFFIAGLIVLSTEDISKNIV